VAVAGALDACLEAGGRQALAAAAATVVRCRLRTPEGDAPREASVRQPDERLPLAPWPRAVRRLWSAYLTWYPPQVTALACALAEAGWPVGLVRDSVTDAEAVHVHTWLQAWLRCAPAWPLVVVPAPLAATLWPLLAVESGGDAS